MCIYFLLNTLRTDDLRIVSLFQLLIWALHITINSLWHVVRLVSICGSSFRWNATRNCQQVTHAQVFL